MERGEKSERFRIRKEGPMAPIGTGFRTGHDPMLVTKGFLSDYGRGGKKIKGHLGKLWMEEGRGSERSITGKQRGYYEQDCSNLDKNTKLE